MLMQEMILQLNNFWAEQGCAILPSYDNEVGAGTFYPATFLRSLEPKPWQVAYTAPTRRPADGRYGENPYRFQFYYQYQVLMKPSPKNIQELFLESLKVLGIDTKAHDIRFVEDNWESPTLATWGLGWEVWMDGMEITQFTYFQQVGGIAVEMIPVELTYGLERIAMSLQQKSHTYEVAYTENLTLGQLREASEYQYSHYNFTHANIDLQKELFERFESENRRLLAENLVYPSYDFMLKASHSFNLLDSRGVLSQTDRQAYIQRLRKMSENVAALHYELVTKESKESKESNDKAQTTRKSGIEQLQAQHETSQLETSQLEVKQNAAKKPNNQDPNNSWYSAVSTKNLWSKK